MSSRTAIAFLPRALRGTPLLLAIATFITPTTAQVSPPRPPPPVVKKAKETPVAGPEAPLQVLDRVVMTVAGARPRVVLQSEIETEFRARRESVERGNEGRKMNILESAKLYRDVKLHFRDAAVQAQAASLKGVTPEQFNQILDKEWRRMQQERIKRMGSLNKMKEEMSRIDRSQFVIERRERQEILLRLAEQDQYTRMRGRLSLMVTPRMLRERFEHWKVRMDTSAFCDLATLVFQIQDPAEADKVLAKAQGAARDWAGAKKSAAVMAQEYGCLALPVQRNLSTTDTAKIPSKSTAEFVARAKTGLVSTPRRDGTVIYLRKIIRYQPAQDFDFADPRVQTLLRRELLTREKARILERAKMRDRAKVYVWTYRPPQR